MKVRILSSEAFKESAADIFGGGFAAQGWAMEVEVLEGIGTLYHGHRTTTVNYEGQKLTLITDGAESAPDLKWVRYLDGSNPMAVEVEVVVNAIINLTQHTGTPEQGVIEPQDMVAINVLPATKKQVQDLLTFDAIPSIEELHNRATELAQIAMYSGAKKAMIGGAPFFMSYLEDALKRVYVQPVYAFSVREAVEIDSVKTSMFKHIGFVESI